MDVSVLPVICGQQIFEENMRSSNIILGLNTLVMELELDER